MSFALMLCCTCERRFASAMSRFDGAPGFGNGWVQPLGPRGGGQTPASVLRPYDPVYLPRLRWDCCCPLGWSHARGAWRICWIDASCAVHGDEQIVAILAKDSDQEIDGGD